MQSKSHWICSNCENQNHETREFCLGCGKPKNRVKLAEGERLRMILEDIGGKNFFKSGRYELPWKATDFGG